MVKNIRDFHGGPAVKTLYFHYGGTGSISGWGTEIPHAMRYGQKKKKIKLPMFKTSKSFFNRLYFSAICSSVLQIFSERFTFFESAKLSTKAYM